MKKTKVFRPRRGMRFSNGRRGVSPSAGFIGGAPIQRTRPNAVIATQALPIGVYPSSSNQMASAVGFGRWDFGWLIDETTGSLTASFTPSAPLALQFDATRGGNALYGTLGWLSGSDLAINIPSGSRNSRFDGGANFNIPAGADLLFGYVGRWRALTASFGANFGRVDSAFTKGWAVNGNNGTNFGFQVFNGISFFGGSIPGGTTGFRVGEWHIGIGGLDRSNGNVKFAIRSLDTGVTLVSNDSFMTAGSPITASSNFYFGATAWVPANETFDLAALYMSTGSQVATGVFPNIVQALENLAIQLGGVVTGVFGSNSNLRSLGDSSESTVGFAGAVMKSVQGLAGDFETFSPVISSSSIYLQGSVSMGKLYERSKLNAQLISAPTNAAGGILPGVTPWPSPTVMDVGRNGAFPGNPSGTFINSVNGRIEPPSWTRSYLGVNQAFVIGALTSSNHENVAFNTFVSGFESLESSAVPAIATTHYSKEQRFQTIIVKKSASFFDTVANQFNSSSEGGGFSPAFTFVSASGSLISQINNPNFAPLTASEPDHPACITIDVPVKGKLVDISVWIELHHESSSLAATITPLGNLGISLKSPNISWGWSTPVDNDPNIINFSDHPTQEEFWTNSYLLWEGSGLYSTAYNSGDGVILDPQRFTGSSEKWHSKFASWNKDRGMRTIFNDGSPTLNPRVNYSSNISGNFVGSPNASLGFNSPWGNDVVWTGSAGSPPRGWLTGPGGTADVNEWPTTGSNLGAESIRPIYPLLDPVFQTIPSVPGISYPNFLSSGGTPRVVDFTKFSGLRPGLRGTEISGTWRIFFTAGRGIPATKFPLWFRQARLEITYENGISGERFNKRNPPAQPISNLLYSVSGMIGTAKVTATLNTNLDIPGQNALFRTFGVAGNSGSVDSSKALLYRLTGSLADIVGSTPSWLFTGPGGMPIIPESSASLVPINAQSIVSIPFSDFLQPRRDLDLPQKLADVASDANVQVSLRDLANIFVSSSTT